MQNVARWTAGKYVYRHGRLVASSDPREVGYASRLVATLVARHYERHLPLHARGRLLDLGCGKVPLYGSYSKLVTENICVDWSNTLHKNDYLDFEADLTQPLAFGDGAFETIILSDVLEHIPMPEALWSEMARVLTGGGKILMNVPYYYWLHERPHDYYRYTEYALRRFVDLAGLELVSLESIGGAPEIMADIFSKCALKVPRIGKLMARIVQRVALSFVDTRLGTKVSEATRDDFPFGYFLVARKKQAVLAPAA